MRENKQKPREELTLEIFPSTSLTLHGKRGGGGGRGREEGTQRRQVRGGRDQPTLHLLHTSLSYFHCFHGQHDTSSLYLASSAFFLLFVSFVYSSYLYLIAFSLVLRLHITYISPMFLLYTLPHLPSLLTLSLSSTSLL